MNPRNTALTLAFLTLTALLGAQELNTTLEVAGLDSAGPPRLLGDHILFTYEFVGQTPEMTSARVHAVEVAFAHENFSVLRSFRRNDQGIFVYLHPVEPDRTSYEYRLVVDGIWTSDPLNSAQITDRWGIRISRIEIPRQLRSFTETPIARSNREFEFIFLAPVGSRVSLVGSFNGWDPFMTELHEIEPGLFSRRIRLGPGEHLYYFLVDGLRIADPTNSRRRWHASGTPVSVVSLP